MSSEINAVTPCQYLFNKEAESLFPGEKSAIANRALETLMKIVDHLVTSNPEALFIFDPTAFNNQCHLYALIVTQITKGGNLDKRFLYFSFFLSYAFLTDQKLLDKVAAKALIEMKEQAPEQFSVFLKDPVCMKIRTQTTRQALNHLFASHMKQLFSSEEGPIYSELARVSNADLQLAASSGPGTLYTLPKLVGIAYMMEIIFKENITLLFKVKVVTKEGRGSFSYSAEKLEKLTPKSPVVVFEMIVTGDSLSNAECREIAKKCPSHSRRNVSSKDRHKENTSCLFCTPNQVDVRPYQEKFQPILANTKEMFFSLSADFVIQKQTTFMPFFTDKDNFPHLSELFERSVLGVEKYSLSMEKPLNMSVSHVYTDCALEASKSSLVIDASYETHLKARGLV